MQRHRNLTWLTSAAIGAALFLGSTACTHPSEYREFPPGDAGRTWQLGDAKVDLEVAETPSLREHGLMGRHSMDENHGMLFIYPKAQVLNFWMKNTPLPLSIAFIDDKGDGKGEVVNIEDMQPYTELPGACSRRAVRLALEMNQGWFAKHGVKAGDTVTLPAWLKEVDAKSDSER